MFILPGTVIEKGEQSGAAFLKGIFSATSGIVLSQVREISGLDTPVLQNWVKRGWVARPQGKKYTEDQLARILIINMLRNVMQIENISFLLTYINGDVNDRSDDIIPESQLYDYVCRIYYLCDGDGEYDLSRLEEYIEKTTAHYVQRIEGSGIRLKKALKIILTAYKASVIKEETRRLLMELRGGESSG